MTKIPENQKELETEICDCYYLKSHLQFKDRTKTNVRARTSIGPFISTTAAYWPAQDKAGWSKSSET